MFDIITIGSATRDVFIFSKDLHSHKSKNAINHVELSLPFGAKINVQKIIFDTGGGATNNAATFRRLGKFKVAALARVGNDPGGNLILDCLKKDKINTSFIQIDNKIQTAYSTILSPGGKISERTILVFRGASEKTESDKIPWGKMKTQWLHISSLGGNLDLLDKIIKNVKAKVALNPGMQELRQNKKLHSIINNVSFLILNRAECAYFAKTPFDNTKKLLKTLSKLKPTCVMTDGVNGAYVVRDNKAYYIPSGGSKSANLTGAGDAFGSGFITGYIKSKGDIKEALIIGTLNANSVVQKVGAKNGILEKYPNKTIKIHEIEL